MAQNKDMDVSCESESNPDARASMLDVENLPRMSIAITDTKVSTQNFATTLRKKKMTWAFLLVMSFSLTVSITLVSTVRNNYTQNIIDLIKNHTDTYSNHGPRSNGAQLIVDAIENDSTNSVHILAASYNVSRLCRIQYLLNDDNIRVSRCLDPDRNRTIIDIRQFIGDKSTIKGIQFDSVDTYSLMQILTDFLLRFDNLS